LANKWTKNNKGHFKAAKKIICQTAGIKNIYDGKEGVDSLI
jgi:hypothetical protein